jgi:hypothetical protein
MKIEHFELSGVTLHPAWIAVVLITLLVLSAAHLAP